MMNSDRRQSDVWLECVPLDETRSEDGTDKVMRVRGYAIVFDSVSERMGSFTETIDRRALDHLGDLNALGVRMQGEHEGVALANSARGTLRLAKDDRGIRIEADLDPRRSDARDLYYAIERGDIDKMSFGFTIAKNGEVIEERDDGSYHAHVTRIERLLEVSAVNWPAYRGTEIGAVEVDDEHASATGDAVVAHDRAFEAELLRLRVERERYS